LNTRILSDLIKKTYHITARLQYQ